MFRGSLRGRGSVFDRDSGRNDKECLIPAGVPRSRGISCFASTSCGRITAARRTDGRGASEAQDLTTLQLLRLGTGRPSFAPLSFKFQKCAACLPISVMASAFNGQASAAEMRQSVRTPGPFRPLEPPDTWQAEPMAYKTAWYPRKGAAACERPDFC